MIVLDNYLNTPTKCNHLYTIDSVETLKNYHRALLKSEKKLIIGDTSNILFSQDFTGTIIKNAIQGEISYQDKGNYVELKVPAGMNWHELVKLSVHNKLWGIENLALIPGLVGSAPIQNIGAYGVELMHCNPIIHGIDLHTMQEKTFTTEECEFSYRESIFKHTLRDIFFISALTLTLSKNEQAILDYAELKTLKQGKKPSQLAIMQTVCDIRKRKLPDPDKVPNIGSFFKNPIIAMGDYNRLLTQYPALSKLSSYTLETTKQIKLSAAALIDACGLKGYTHSGGAQVSTQHALVLTNPQAKTGKAILELAHFIQATVKQQYGIDLCTEVRII